MAKKKKVEARKVPCREEKYMGLAFWVASFSKDPSTQNGCVIISTDNRPLGMGYNGPPRVYGDLDIDWSRPEKYKDMVHAEMNAIWHCSESPSGATLYCTAIPCQACMLQLVVVGIDNVIYYTGHHFDSGSMCADKSQHKEIEEIARKGRVTLEKFDGNLNWMRDRVRRMEIMGIFD